MKKRIALLIAVVILAMPILTACDAERGVSGKASDGEISGDISRGVAKSGEAVFAPYVLESASVPVSSSELAPESPYETSAPVGEDTDAEISGGDGEPTANATGESDYGGELPEQQEPISPSESPSPSQASAEPEESGSERERPIAASGSYNGQPITVRYTAFTNVIWPNDRHYYWPFINGFSVIFTKYNFQFIDKEGHVIGGYGACHPFEADGRALVHLIGEGREWVYIDTAGNVLETSTYRGTEPSDWRIMDAGEGLFFYAVEGVGGTRWGLMDADGNRIMEPVLYNPAGEFAGGLFLTQFVGSPRRFALIDTTGATVASLPDDIDWAFQSGDSGAVICRYGEYSAPGTYEQLFDSHTGEPLSDEKYVRIGQFHDGLALVFRDGKVGIIDNRGNVVVAPAIYYDSWEGSDPKQGGVNLYMDEDLFMIPNHGMIAILEVIRG